MTDTAKITLTYILYFILFWLVTAGLHFFFKKDKSFYEIGEDLWTNRFLSSAKEMLPVAALLTAAVFMSSTQ